MTDTEVTEHYSPSLPPTSALGRLGVFWERKIELIGLLLSLSTLLAGPRCDGGSVYGRDVTSSVEGE